MENSWRDRLREMIEADGRSKRAKRGLLALLILAAFLSREKKIHALTWIALYMHAKACILLLNSSDPPIWIASPDIGNEEQGKWN